MGALGKVLIVFNLLAGGGFFYLAAKDWQKRQEFAFAAFRSQVALDGLPLDSVEPKPADLDEQTEVPFAYRITGGKALDRIRKDTLTKLVPAGGTQFGGEAVPNQVAEFQRVQKKVADALAKMANDPAAKRNLTLTYLFDLAKGGAERDGVRALADVLDPKKAATARRDLPFLARTAPQVTALQALLAVGDLTAPDALKDANRVKVAREALFVMARAEAPQAIPAGGDAKVRDESLRQVVNAVEELVAEVTTPTGAVNDKKKALADKAPAGLRPAFELLADAVAAPLADPAAVTALKAKLVDLTRVRARTDAEKKGLTAVADLILPAAEGDPAALVDAAGAALLDQHFAEVLRPVSEGKQGEAYSEGAKRRQIAHVLVHLDAHNHTGADDAGLKERKAWHQRVAAVVGLREYVRASEAQATQYSEAANRLLNVILDEQTAFEAEFQANVQRALFLSSQALTLDLQYQAQAARKDEHDKFLADRKDEKEKLDASLEKAKKDAKDTLAKLAEKERQLFELQKGLRDDQQRLFDMEKQLRELESKFGGR